MRDTDTLRSKIQRQDIRDELMKTEWNGFLTLLFHRHLPLEVGHKLIYKWDGLVSRRMVGRRFHKSKNYGKRMVFFGCSGFDGNRHLHTHLLVKVPNETEMDGFRGVCEDSFTRVVDKGEVYLSSNKKNYLDETDKDNIVSYTTLHRHLGTDEMGLDTSSIVISTNYEMMM